jgi:3-hydroxypropanoate dehydrogenase
MSETTLATDILEIPVTTALDSAGRNLLFCEARTHRFWQDEPVGDGTLRELYDLLKWGPTSANTCPMRVVFLRTREAKERLRPALAPGNVDKTMTAPVTAIIAYDWNFPDKLAQLWPNNPKIREAFRTPESIEDTARRNGTLQAAYLILAARAVGLDCGPMTGFDAATVDAEFFPVGQALFPGGRPRSDILCNLGYGEQSRLHARNPRLEFADACALL